MSQVGNENLQMQEKGGNSVCQKGRVFGMEHDSHKLQDGHADEQLVLRSCTYPEHLVGLREPGLRLLLGGSLRFRCCPKHSRRQRLLELSGVVAVVDCEECWDLEHENAMELRNHLWWQRWGLGRTGRRGSVGLRPCVVTLRIK